MTARAIYKARLFVGELEVPIKFYSAVEDKGVHFRLLHASDRQPVAQQMIDKTTDEPVERERVNKAFETDDQKLVMLRSDELEALEPEASRDVVIHRCVDSSSIKPHFYDRPYYLGPDGDDESYFALSQTLRQRNLEGLASWVMRKRRYVGALREHQGYLVMITLRFAEEVVDVGTVARPDQKEIAKQEVKLARQLVDALDGPFEADLFEDDHRIRLQELIFRKARGQVIQIHPRRRKKPTESLTDALQGSLKAIKSKRSA